MEYLKFIEKDEIIQTILLTTLIIATFKIISFIVKQSLKRKYEDESEKNYIKKKVDQTTHLLIVLGMFFLWFSQLQSVFVSLLVVATAFVLAFKELIMCLTGGILLQAGRSVKVGDRITINDFKGYVVEKNLLTTKILQIGSGKYSIQTNGNVLTIPNSLLLNNILINESYFQGFSIRSFIFKVPDLKSIDKFEAYLLEKAREISGPYERQAEVQIHKFCKKEGILIPSVEAKTRIIIDDNNNVSILLKIPVKSSDAAGVEQDVNRAVVDYLNLIQ